MQKVVSVHVILILLVGLLGLSFSVCRDFLARTPEIRMATSCGDDGFCRKMCLLGQDDSPGLLHKSCSDFQSTVSPLPADSALPPLFESEPSFEALSHQLAGPAPSGAVYLLNAAFLI